MTAVSSSSLGLKIQRRSGTESTIQESNHGQGEARGAQGLQQWIGYNGTRWQFVQRSDSLWRFARMRMRNWVIARRLKLTARQPGGFSKPSWKLRAPSDLRRLVSQEAAARPGDF